MKVYNLPTSLTPFQEKVYKHLIDVKWRLFPETESNPGIFKGHKYDAIFPEDFKCQRIPEGVPFMFYKKCIEKNNQLSYKLHKFANHAVSSQTACVNLFLPFLESTHANEILRGLSSCPKDFGEIDRESLTNGYCFEFWDEESGTEGGHLGDHTPQAGTDSDVAIVYKNTQGEKCVWLIEHKLTEREFTACGGYQSSKADKDYCNKCNPLTELQKSNIDKCTYSKNGYKYWDITKNHLGAFSSVATTLTGCPFKKGMNQLWRNQLLAFALVDSKRFASAHFSVVYHPGNNDLENKLIEYGKFFNPNIGFNYFTSKEIIDVAERYIDNDSELADWVKWYKETYLDI